MMEPLTKYTRQLVSGATIPSRVREAFRIAQEENLPEALFGPTIEEVALGGYQEDFEFVADSGHVDVHNGRFTITPDYPDGTYAYFVTLDDEGTSAFPHIMGTSFYGEVVSQQNVVVPEGATAFVPEPNGFSLLVVGSLLLGLVKRRSRCG